MALQIDSITPTSISATVGTVVPMSCAASGEYKTIGNFSARPLPISAQRVYGIEENSATGRIYVAIGFPVGQADLYYTDNQGSSYTLFSDTTSTAIHSLIVRTNGDVIHTISTDSDLSGTVFLNGSILRSAGSDAYVSFGIDKFSNGNVCIAIGNASATSGAVLLVSSSNVVTNAFSQTYRLNGLVVDGTGSVGYTTDYTGRVFKTTDSGVNWAEISRPVSSSSSRCIIGVLPNNDVIYVNTLDNIWRISTNGGSTFSVWANPPSASYTVYEQIRTTGNGVIFGALNSPTVCELYDGVWRYKTVGTGIDEIFSAPLIQNTKIFAGSGVGADDGDLWVADYAGTVSKTLIDTSDSSVLSTVSPYNYTADIADDNKNFQWSVTDGVTTVQSALIPVNITTARRRIIIT